MSIKVQSKIYYCGMVNTRAYGKLVSESLEIAAASIKMTSIVSAMREINAKAILVTMPVLGKSCPKRYMPSVVLRDQDIPQVIFSTFANPILRKIYSFINFGIFCISKVNKLDKVIIYNHGYEYLLGLLILRIKKVSTFLDIEDMPCIDVKGTRAKLDRLLFYTFIKFTNPRKIVVSKSVASKIDIHKYCVVYGATKTKELNDTIFSESNRFSDTPFRILYSGTLATDTGLDLFCSAIIEIAKIKPRGSILIEVIVSGFGGADRIENLVKLCENSAVNIIYKRYMPQDKYEEIIKTCHAGLCLKMPDSEISQTTFPSKVIEITKNGMLLISTCASDVPELFDSKSALILPTTTKQALVDAILYAYSNPNVVEMLAAQGRIRSNELFESKKVGKRIIDFINE